jgi:hypothetical protein
VIAVSGRLERDDSAVASKTSGRILEAYPTPADICIIHRVDDIAHVMVNGTMGSENPKYKRGGPR